MNQQSASLIKSFCVGLCFAVVPTAVAAAELDECVQDSTCRDAEDRGLSLSARGEHREALNAFRAAYAHTPAPRLLINIGRSLFHLSRPLEALEYYERFTRARASADPEVEQKVQRYVQEARAALAAMAAALGSPGTSADAEPPPDALPALTAAPAIHAPHAVPGVPYRSALPATSAVLLSLGGAGLAAGCGLGVRTGWLATEVLSGSGPFNNDLYTQGMVFSRAAVALDVIGGAAVVAGAIGIGIWRARRHRQVAPSPSEALSVKSP